MTVCGPDVMPRDPGEWVPCAPQPYSFQLEESFCCERSDIFDGAISAAGQRQHVEIHRCRARVLGRRLGVHRRCRHRWPFGHRA